jgi:hypothetical protein
MNYSTICSAVVLFANSEVVGLAPGSSLTIVSYNASVVKSYNTTNRCDFKAKILYSALWKNVLAYYGRRQGWSCKLSDGTTSEYDFVSYEKKFSLQTYEYTLRRNPVNLHSRIFKSMALKSLDIYLIWASLKKMWQMPLFLI